MPEILIRVHRGGSMVQADDDIQYVGGLVHEFKEDTDFISPFDFLHNLRSKKYKAKKVAIWYCLPGKSLYHGRKSLCNHQDLNDLCLAAQNDPSNSVDVYIEHSIDDPSFRDVNDIFNMRMDTGGSCGGGQNIGDDDSSSDAQDYAPYDEFESSSHSASMEPTSDEEVQLIQNTRRHGSDLRIAFLGDVQPLLDIEAFMDDEDPPTDNDSDDPFAEFDRPKCKYPSYPRLTNTKHVNFALEQTFTDAAEFRAAVIRYSIASHRDIRFERSNREKVCAVCGDKKCSWRIWCSYNKNINRFQVKTFVDDHTCEHKEKVRMGNTAWLTEMFMEKFRSNLSYKAKHLREDCLKEFGITVSINKCWRARYGCLRQIQGNQNEHFRKIRNYKLELERSNIGSTIKIEANNVEPDKPVFRRMFIGFKELKQGWLAGCRPIIGLDGCFLKWFVKGELLSAVGRDVNNQMYPIAWAVVEVENADSWEWFRKLVMKDMGFKEGVGLTIMSDGQKGLEAAVQKVLPRASRRLCARHVYSNWRKKHKIPELRPLFWAAAKSTTENQVKDVLREIQKVSTDAFNDLKNSNLKTWCRAYFKDDSSSDVVQNNLSEAFNSSIRDARTKPVIDMFEDIRKSVMLRIATQLDKIEEWPGIITPRIQKFIDESLKRSFKSNVMHNGRKIYEVSFFDDVRTVDMNKMDCQCRQWEITGIPCFHALAVIMYRKESIVDYVAHWYKKPAWKNCYSHVLTPINGEKEWPRSHEPILLPPPDRVMPGRPKKNRMKAAHESPQKKKTSTRHGRTMTCRHCLEQGHNQATCKKKAIDKDPAPRPEPIRKRRGRPPSAHPRSGNNVRNRQRGGRTNQSTWNREEMMFCEGYGVYYDQGSGNLMLQSGRNRYAADGSIRQSIPGPSQVMMQCSESGTHSQPPPMSQSNSTDAGLNAN